MIAARLAAPRRAALLTGLVLGAAALRSLLLPVGDAFSTAIFAACLLGITRIGNPHPSPPPQAGEGVLKTGRLAAAGVALGLLLLLPVMAGPMTGRALGDFWSWAVIAAVVATLEEMAIRGALYRAWLAEAGPLAAIGIGAVTFALIHLPRYGLAAMPLDLAVGLSLGGLRAVTGRVAPCAIAHTIADWGAWIWA